MEYKLLVETAEFLKLRAPSAELIEAICYASDDALFRKAKFWRSLMDYKKYGLRPPRATKTSVERELRYIQARIRKYVN